MHAGLWPANLTYKTSIRSIFPISPLNIIDFQPAMYLHLMICTTFLCLSLFHLPSFCRPASPEINLYIKQKKKVPQNQRNTCWLLLTRECQVWRLEVMFFFFVGCGLYGFISPPLKWPTFRLEPLWRVGATCKEGHLVRDLKSQHVSVMWYDVISWCMSRWVEVYLCFFLS